MKILQSSLQRNWSCSLKLSNLHIFLVFHILSSLLRAFFSMRLQYLSPFPPWICFLVSVYRGDDTFLTSSPEARRLFYSAIFWLFPLLAGRMGGRTEWLSSARGDGLLNEDAEQGRRAWGSSFPLWVSSQHFPAPLYPSPNYKHLAQWIGKMGPLGKFGCLLLLSIKFYWNTAIHTHLLPCYFGFYSSYTKVKHRLYGSDA